MAEQFDQEWGAHSAAQEVELALQRSPAYAQLDEPTRRSLASSLARVAAAAVPSTSLAGIDDLRSQMAGGHADESSTGQPAAPAPGSPSSGAPASGSSPGGRPPGPVSQVGDVARATLSAIDFPAFVAGLIQGTFQAIVDASIQQMEAYAELLKNVAMNLDKFMGDNVPEQAARDHLADQYDSVFARDTTNGDPKLVVKSDASDAPLPSFISDLGFSSASDLDDEAVNNVVVPAARRSMAQTRQQTLATMVLMGINRVVVDDGEINAKLQFHVDASEATKIKFDQKKTTNGTIAGRAGRNPFSANAIMVNTVNLNAQSDLNVRADLTGEVKVKFRSETFPLERFADSAAIQLIDQNAKVPAPAPAPAPSTPAAAAPPAAPAGAATPAAPAAAAATPANGHDPWSRP